MTGPTGPTGVSGAGTFVTKAADFTASTSGDIYRCTATLAVTLPAAAGNTDVFYGFVNVSAAGFVKIAGMSIRLLPGESVVVRSDGTSWYFTTTNLRHPLYSPLRPPVTATSQDDEYEDTSADAKWTDVNWSGTGFASDVNTTKKGHLYVDAGTSAASKLRARMQTLPAGDFTVYTYCHGLFKPADFQYVGLLFADGTTDGAGNDFSAALISGASIFSRSSSGGTNYGNFASNLMTSYAWWDQHAFIRVRRASSVYTVAFSPDGFTWIPETITPGFTPTKFGPFVSHNTTTNQHLGAWDFVRYFADATSKINGL